MTKKRVLLGTIFVLALGCFAFASSSFTGNAQISLRFSPSHPAMADNQVEVSVIADLGNVQTGSSATPILTSFAMPIGFDPSYVRLISLAPGTAAGYGTAGFAFTSLDIANGRGFVTVMNSRTGSENPGREVELARLVFQFKRPGNTTFIAGSARTIRQGTLAAAPSDIQTAVERLSWADSIYVLRIEPGATLPGFVCPTWVSTSDMYQGLALLNEGAETTSIQMFGWGADGTLIQSASATNPSLPSPLASLNQDARVTDQIFASTGTMNVQRGWIEAKVDKPDVTGFFLQGSTSVSGTQKMDGVPITYSPASRLLFPLIRDPNRNTEISLVNPNSNLVNIQMQVRDPSGQVLRVITGELQPHGMFIQQIQDATAEKGVYVDVQAAGGNLVGIERFGTDDSLATLSGQDPELASTRLSAPQFASGFLEGTLRIDTHVALVNSSAFPTTVILRLLNETGVELAAPAVRVLNGGAMLSVEGWKLFGLPNPATTRTLTVGSIFIESDEKVLGAISFGDPTSGKYLSALPLMSTSSARREMTFGQVAVGTLENVSYFTGLALVNPSPMDTANINIELHATDGSILAQTTEPFRLGPGSRTANLVQQLIPSFPATQFGGYIRLTSDVEVHGYMLIGDNFYNFLSAVP